MKRTLCSPCRRRTGSKPVEVLWYTYWLKLHFRLCFRACNQGLNSFRVSQHILERVSKKLKEGILAFNVAMWCERSLSSIHSRGSLSFFPLLDQTTQQGKPKYLDPTQIWRNSSIPDAIAALKTPHLRDGFYCHCCHCCPAVCPEHVWVWVLLPGACCFMRPKTKVHTADNNLSNWLTDWWTQTCCEARWLVLLGVCLSTQNEALAQHRVSSLFSFPFLHRCFAIWTTFPSRFF